MINRIKKNNNKYSFIKVFINNNAKNIKILINISIILKIIINTFKLNNNLNFNYFYHLYIKYKLIYIIIDNKTMISKKTKKIYINF